MAARPAIALSLVALLWTASAHATDNPACAQYHDALSYNLCLASHGPKAKNVGRPSGQPQPGRASPKRVWRGHSRGAPSTRFHAAPSTRFYDTQGSPRIHGRAHMEFQVH